jgi:hypothetical protein
MSIYFKSIGFSIVLIGILDGVPEATAGFRKNLLESFLTSQVKGFHSCRQVMLSMK